MRKVGYDGKIFVLVDSDSGEPVYPGDLVTDFRGDKAEIMNGTAPHKPASCGHVITRRDNVDWTSESYVTVFNLRWTEEPVNATE